VFNGMTANGSVLPEVGIFRVPSADTEADLFSIAEDNICRSIKFRHPDN
jgi:hypothetical protein